MNSKYYTKSGQKRKIYCQEGDCKRGATWDKPDNNAKNALERTEDIELDFNHENCIFRYDKHPKAIEIIKGCRM